VIAVLYWREGVYFAMWSLSASGGKSS